MLQKDTFVHRNKTDSVIGPRLSSLGMMAREASDMMKTVSGGRLKVVKWTE
jgi:hypothetical protein